MSGWPGCRRNHIKACFWCNPETGLLILRKWQKRDTKKGEGKLLKLSKEVFYEF